MEIGERYAEAMKDETASCLVVGDPRHERIYRFDLRDGHAHPYTVILEPEPDQAENLYGIGLIGFSEDAGAAAHIEH